MYKVTEFASRLGVSVSTLRRWDSEGILKPAKVTDGGTRYYSEEQEHAYFNRKVVEPKKVIVGY